MGRRMNLVGDTYGELTVVSFSHTTESNGMSNYLCRCSCGSEKVFSHGNLRSGHSKSCGCARPKGDQVWNYSHGFKKSHKTYKSWCKIKERCLNPNDNSYHGYGAKWITISEKFKDNFLAFYAEVGEPPINTSDWSIDRIDNTRGYEPGNLRWANSETQARNKGKSSVNTSGVNGVQFYDHQGRNGTSWLYVVATWYSLGTNGKAQNKKFSVKKHGLLPAFKMACEYRLKMIEELNAQGAGYTENHGK